MWKGIGTAERKRKRSKICFENFTDKILGSGTNSFSVSPVNETRPYNSFHNYYLFLDTEPLYLLRHPSNAKGRGACRAMMAIPSFLNMKVVKSNPLILVLPNGVVNIPEQLKFLGNCPPSPPLSQHYHLLLT